MKPKTKETFFNAQSLPAWARRDEDVVALCESNLSFRCDVCTAETEETRRDLRKLARLVMAGEIAEPMI